jgi:hypothetical protein
MADVTGSAALAEVARCFPRHRSVIETLARASSEFRSLCDDYAVAATTLRLLEASREPGTQERVAEYRELVAELAREISSSLVGASSP